MNEVVKSPRIYGLTGLVEASYGAGGSPSASTDGILLEELPQITIAPGYDGSRPAPPGSMGYQPRALPNGITASLPVKVAVRGAGAAYSASVKPSIHTLLRICGFDAALTSTPGVEKYVYTPTPGPTGYGSGVFNAYPRGELWPLTAAYADWELEGDSTGVVMFTATISALLGTISDIACPAITYSLAGVLPPASVGSGLFTLGNFINANLRKWKLKGGRKIGPRLNQNSAGGHAGFAIGNRTPSLDVTYETPALTTTPYHAASAIDPYQLWLNAVSLAFAIQIGSVQYNKHKWSGPAAQVMAAPVAGEDGDVATTTLSLQLNPSAANTNDELSATFD